ncbi:LLM class flavin-dependent oxidoreductase [Blastococcus sp. BMG 814]|uniref:LLM class flavin-dependent oxidoreductase n=1 Tax=Blastococcus carthaginiensis TaxID=3050034 RepID=A0ABT9IA96_9ACTN|nr:LLM class flavin-dependent oxidoreductase [Blastococcus carthaginiensis]MDP5182494.1 LLM class flavin-dependent oxidoreductase [Blastococcus carthaginiensis]
MTLSTDPSGQPDTSIDASSPLRVGIRIPPCRPVGELVEVAQQAEELGYDQVWLPDSQLLWRDVYATAAVVVAGTSRIGVGTAVTNVVTRHPAVVASAARTVAELAPGRFTLGLGVGDSAVRPVGLRQSTGADMRERVGMIRTLLAGEEVDFHGVRSRLRDPMPDVPLHMAASGPKNLRLAGEIADGAILLSGVAPDNLSASTSRVREGARAVGKTTQVPITVSAFCRVTDDVEAAARELKPICAGIAQNGGGSFLELAGVHVAHVPRHVLGVYPDLVHAEDWDLAVRACDEFVSDEAVVAFARHFCLYGTAEEIVGRLRAVAAVGATSVFLQHVGSYTLPHELLTLFATDVMPRLRVAAVG